MKDKLSSRLVSTSFLFLACPVDQATAKILIPNTYEVGPRQLLILFLISYINTC